MIRVGIVSTQAPERCGLRIYTEELINNAADQGITFDVIGRPFDNSVVDRASNFDIVHVMHVGNLFGSFSTNQVEAIKARGIKTVCTWHESNASGNRNPFTQAFDRVVIHEPTADGFDVIYHGVPHAQLNGDRSLSGFIGTSGFPIPFKNYPLAARLARAVGRKLYAFLPESQHADVRWVESEILLQNPGSVVQKGFPPHEHIVQTLSQCDFTLFPYRQENTGIGGSMRVGIGAQRPVVISDVIRFRDILANPTFEKEFYVIPSQYPTFENAMPTLIQCANDVANGRERIPRQTFEAMSWKVSAQRYVEIYKGLMR